MVNMNFAMAKEELLSCYDNPQILVMSHMNQSSIASITKASAYRKSVCLISIFNQTNRSFKAINSTMDQYEWLFIEKLEKLDKFFRLLWELSHVFNKMIFTYDELLNKLLNELSFCFECLRATRRSVTSIQTSSRILQRTNAAKITMTNATSASKRCLCPYVAIACVYVHCAE